MNLIKHILEAIDKGNHLARRDWMIDVVDGMEKIAKKYHLKRDSEGYCWYRDMLRVRIEVRHIKDAELLHSLGGEYSKHVLSVEIPDGLYFVVDGFDLRTDYYLPYPENPSHILSTIDHSLAHRLKESIDEPN
jgi:hypothetical protein